MTIFSMDCGLQYPILLAWIAPLFSIEFIEDLEVVFGSIIHECMACFHAFRKCTTTRSISSCIFWCSNVGHCQYVQTFGQDQSSFLVIIKGDACYHWASEFYWIFGGTMLHLEGNIAFHLVPIAK
eukprot:182375_1